MPECAKAHIQQFRISKKFPVEDLRIPHFPERGQGKVGNKEKGKGREKVGEEKGKGQGGKGRVEEGSAPQRKIYH